MIHNLRTRVAKWFWQVATMVTPPVEDSPLYKTLPEELKESQDAVVEADETNEQWSPDQHGNVVIVEPPLMTKYRRNKL